MNLYDDYSPACLGVRNSLGIYKGRCRSSSFDFRWRWFRLSLHRTDVKRHNIIEENKGGKPAFAFAVLLRLTLSLSWVELVSLLDSFDSWPLAWLHSFPAAGVVARGSQNLIDHNKLCELLPSRPNGLGTNNNLGRFLNMFARPIPSPGKDQTRTWVINLCWGTISFSLWKWLLESVPKIGQAEPIRFPTVTFTSWCWSCSNRGWSPMCMSGLSQGHSSTAHTWKLTPAKSPDVITPRQFWWTSLGGKCLDCGNFQTWCDLAEAYQ